jgi:tRNA modification GTPase
LGDLYIDSRRQYDLLHRASDALSEARRGVREEVSMDFVASDLKEAVDALGEITGEVTSADILQKIFSDFCVGK